MNWIDLEDIALRYELTGQRTQTVVLLHELGGSLESFDSLTLLLAARLPVLRYDLRGAGLSEQPRRARSLAFWRRCRVGGIVNGRSACA